MTDAIISGILLGLALVFSLGPAIFTILKLRISYGKVSAYYFVAGIWISDIIWVVTANLFGGLLKTLIVHKNLIGLTGGGFLMGLGVFYLFFKKYHSRDEIDSGIRIGAATHAKLFITGLLMNLLNPGVIALWFAAATKTITNAFSMNERIATFSLCLAISMTSDIFKVNLAGKIRRNLTDRNISIINRLAGTMFLLFGLALIIGTIKMMRTTS
jgi:threonine/homoserine/homoserine lactone efflux protein